MAQWFTLKAEHPDALLFFRMGDFYELFFSDAEAAASALDIALTARGTHAGEPIPMCGVPVTAAPAYLPRLIRRGFRVAVAEQTEAARKPGSGAKGPLARAVVRLITAGTLTEDEMLEASRPNLLLAVAIVADRTLGASFIDISTGSFETAALRDAGALMELLGRLDPAEILAPAGLPLGDHEHKRAPQQLAPDPEAARKRVARLFGVANLDAFGSFSDAEAIAAAVALDYVRRAQAGRLPRLSHPIAAAETGLMGLDPATRTSLELLRARDGGTGHTLFSATCRTVTATGSRLLGRWLSAPLCDLAALQQRQAAWRFLQDQPRRTALLRTILRGAPDLARALGRLSLGRGQPRDLEAVRQALRCGRESAAALGEEPPSSALPVLLRQAHDRCERGTALEELLGRALAAELPARLEDGGAIAAGFDGELDAQRHLRDDGRRLLAALQLDYAQCFGVASLKIRHHQQLGYVIEMSAAAARGVRTDIPPAGRQDRLLLFRQGTASLSRFSTPELSDLDRRIAEAAGEAERRERLVFDTLVAQVLADPSLPALAESLALLDVAQSCATLAAGGQWCCPQLREDAGFLLKGARHPVVEAALPRGERFTPNDCDLSPGRRVMLLTGPNMAGKSTFLRQAALAVVLAQAGLPVPAVEARIGLVDRLFSRVGAADDLARGRSTFMVEMTEAAAILHQAGPRSLVVVDEIGRGTATLDGLAIAWAVLEAIHGQLRSRAIFATHFHELAELAESLPALRPHTMSVREWKGEVVFRHEVVDGVAGRSWGVHVARLAGVPEPVVRRAARLLAELERTRALTAPALPLFAQAEPRGEQGAPEADEVPPPLRAVLDALDPDVLTPREALAALYRLKALLADSDGESESPVPAITPALS
ncbi:DNA mismatch repair protein MutS [Rhizosaccharibacter radicis]|uniref:DNA mismatch repair protein MutS n=1 Tax=Rhizosaccharibacter radicis TaxID=2782605 RepID=A0ABT1VZU9_9PROT|nr:DNA mismatch repair protein MutS [Acetobacteraceae bacterium KSS12]